MTFLPERIHYSQLKYFERSPAHFRAACLGERVETPAMRFGTAVHVLVLGGDAVVFPGEQRRGNAWKAFQAIVDGQDVYVYDGRHDGKGWAGAKKAAAGRLIVSSEDLEVAREGATLQAARRRLGKYDAPILTPPEMERARRCADAVLACPEAVELLQGVREAPLQWEVLGRAAAGQLDVLSPAQVTDLKVSHSSNPSTFPRHAEGQTWHAQLAWYLEGARQNGFNADRAHIVAVESREPYVVTCFRLTPATIEEGQRVVRAWMERLLACEAADAWPGYVQSVVELDIQPWSPDEGGDLSFLDFGGDAA